MTIEKEQWKRVLTELVENKCSYCQKITPYTKRYIQIRDELNKFYVIDAYCSTCYYNIYLEGFPWSTDISKIPFVYRIAKGTRYDTVDIEYYY